MDTEDDLNPILGARRHKRGSRDDLRNQSRRRDGLRAGANTRNLRGSPGVRGPEACTRRRTREGRLVSPDAGGRRTKSEFVEKEISPVLLTEVRVERGTNK